MLNLTNFEFPCSINNNNLKFDNLLSLMRNQILVLLSLLSLCGCSNYIRVDKVDSVVPVDEINQNMSFIASHDKDLKNYIRYSKSIFPDTANLPGLEDLEKQSWSPPTLLSVGKGSYQSDLNREEGTVVIATLFSENGFVIISMIVKSTNEKLNNSATHSVTNWRVSPAKIDGNPCKSVLYSTYNFKVSNGSAAVVSP